MTLAENRYAPEPVASVDVIVCRDPATGRILGEVPVDGPAEVRAAVERSRRAQIPWGAASPKRRVRVLRTILAHMVEHAEELAELAALDAGKTRENAMMGEIWPVCEKLRWTIAEGPKHLRSERVSSGLFVHKRAVIEYHPRGVVGVICPWNYPVQNVLGPAISALMAGNGCVIKVSEAVAWSSRRIERVFHEALTEHGYAPELVSLVNGYGETGAALVRSGVDLVVFTGSLPNGRKIIEGSAEHVTPVILELGGKDAMIICDDCDLEEAVHSAMAGVFIAAGQNCLAAERLLVFDGIYNRFVERVSALVKELRQGPPLAGSLVDVGAIVSPQQVDVIERLVNDAVERGATVLTGGTRARTDEGLFFAPTILTEVTDEMAISREETFGPVMCIRRVTSEEDAIRVANATPFGLSATLFTTSRRRAGRMAKKLEAGSTCVNGFGLTYMAQDLPFGGIKGSGFGRLNGRDGLRRMCNQKSVLYDRLPVHTPTVLYPVKPGDYDAAYAAIRTIYGRGAKAKLQGILGLLAARKSKSS
ncbi:MAG: aldehyde dehydrogenase family protein [Myxococcota bacterium]